MKAVTKSGRVSPTAVRRALEGTAGISLLGSGKSIRGAHHALVRWDRHRGGSLQAALDALEDLGLWVEVIIQNRNEASLRIHPPCDHPDNDWDHHFDPDSVLGDYYTCPICGAVMQVG